ncbi:uncharacterized protein LOC124391502 [Silurus meridionalis]|nr:uncharacterized protein LOC124391502 [Silurus meridionalis]
MVSMVSQMEQNAQPRPQVLLVGAKDSKRLLEMYVKRSLSLNDGSHFPARRERRTHKWVTPAERDKRERKHSSEIILSHNSLGAEDDIEDEAFSDLETDQKDQLESDSTENRSKELVKKIIHRRNDGSSASDGKAQKSRVHADKDNPDEREQNSKPVPHSQPLASEVDISKDKEEIEPVTENETLDKVKPRKKNSLVRKDGSSASQNPNEKHRKWFLTFDKEKKDGMLSEKGFKLNLEEPRTEDHLLNRSTEVKKTKEGKKNKKSSVWKSFLGLFSRGNTDKQDEHDDEERTEKVFPTEEPATPPFSCLPLTTGDGSVSRNTKTNKRRRSQRRISFKSGRPFTLELSTDAHNSQVQSIEEVEATTSYYEKMSEELKKIVNEVKNTPTEENKTFIDSVQPADTDASKSQEEIIKRIIVLIKQEGDAINGKLKENATISSYLNTITYGSFEQLADQYVKYEVPQQKTQGSVVAPELVKFAFTLDFTARVAGLSRYAPGHILGFGNQYLMERFSYMSESHPYLSDVTLEKQETVQTRINGSEDHAEGSHLLNQIDQNIT